MKVLITGAFGYVGRVVTRLAAADGHSIVALAHEHFDGSLAAANVTVAHGDVRSTDAMRPLLTDVDAVVHLAGLAAVGVSFDQQREYDEINLGGTANLLRLLADRQGTGPKATFIHASTARVYGRPDKQPIAESSLPNPTNAYGASKLAAENAVRSYSLAGAVAGISLRAFNVAGADGRLGDHNVARVIPRALDVAAGRQQHLPIAGDGSTVRDFVHVADVADAYVKALRAANHGAFQVFNVGASAASIRDVVRMVEQVTGRRVHTEPARPGLVEDVDLRADTRLIRDRLGWRPVRSSLENIVADAWSALTAPGNGGEVNPWATSMN
jgi:UDP-glucose 4-epimerase